MMNLYTKDDKVYSAHEVEDGYLMQPWDHLGEAIHVTDLDGFEEA